MDGEPGGQDEKGDKPIEPSVEYYEDDFDWISHVLGKFNAHDVEDDLKREMEEGDGGGDGWTDISAW